MRIRRRALAFLDQGVSSGSNFFLAACVARSLSAREFGVYALLASVYWVVLGAARALIGEPMLIFGPAADVDGDGGGNALSAAVTLGVLIAIPLVGAGSLLSSPALIALAVAMPVLLVQDAMRYVFFARSAPGRALLADSIWLGVQLSLATVLFALRSSSLDLWIYSWACAALASVVLTALATRLRPSFAGWLKWIRRVRSTSWKLLGDFVITQGAQQAVIFVLPLVAGLSVLGALKAAQVAVGPMSVCMNGAVLLALPSIARATTAGRADLAIRRGASISLAGVLLGAVYTIVAVALPKHVGSAVFGESWLRGDQLLPYVALQYTMIALIMGAVVVLRGTQNAGRSLVIRIVVTPMNLGLPLIGVWLGGARGLGIALLVSGAVGAVVWWLAVGALWRSFSRTGRWACAATTGS